MLNLRIEDHPRCTNRNFRLMGMYFFFFFCSRQCSTSVVNVRHLTKVKTNHLVDSRSLKAENADNIMYAIKALYTSH